MAPDTQSIDFDASFLTLGLAHALPLLPLDNSIDHLEYAGGETLSATIKRVDLDDEDEDDEDEEDDDDLDEEDDDEEYEDDEDEEDEEEDDDEYDDDEDDDSDDDEEEEDEELNLI
jgi:hypothetical protein